MDSEKTKQINIAIIENNRFIRIGWEMVLLDHPEFNIIGSYPNCESAFISPMIGKVDIVLMDMHLTGISGIEGIRFLRDKHPHQIILACSVREDNENLFEAICYGAFGFLSKNASSKEFISSIQDAIQGYSPMIPAVARRILLFWHKNPAKIADKLESFTEKEITILDKIACGNSYSTVANELSVDETDILINLREIYQKLQQIRVSN